jgi:ComF family protein
MSKSFKEKLGWIKDFFLNLFFPKNCINCQKEGSYLCEDCFSLIEVLSNQFCPFCNPPRIVLEGRTCNSCQRTKNLSGLFCAAPYQNFIIKKLISQLKYEPCLKALSKPLSLLIVKHFQLLEQGTSLTGAVFVPVPISKKRLRRRGFNQAEEIARELALAFNIPLLNNVLFKTKETQAQAELSAEERKENVKGVFACKNPEMVNGQKILLIDDVFTTGSTMEECSRVLKEGGAKEVWGIAVARE